MQSIQIINGGFFYQMKLLESKEEFVSALKAGEYIIGADVFPNGKLENVFHYDNGKFEIFRFKDVSRTINPPLKLVRDKSILNVDVQHAFDFLAHYDVFFVSQDGNFLDIENIPHSKYAKIISCIEETARNYYPDDDEEVD